MSWQTNPAMIGLCIDTEGFELDVLNGMQEILNRTTLRAVFIERLLSEKGFRNRWLDLSHLAAYRL